MVIDFLRQSDLIKQSQLEVLPITVIGAGGIGSPTVLALAKMGAKKITVYDHDKVEPHNLPNQFYRLKDLNNYKVSALAEIAKEYTGTVIECVPDKYTGQPIGGVIIAAVDSMSARKEIFSGVINAGMSMMYVDARMGAEVASIYTSTTEQHREKYRETLYSDGEAHSEPCTARAIIYNTFGIASLIANQVKRFCNNQPLVNDITFDYATLTLTSETWA